MVAQDQPSASGSSYVLMCQENTEQVFVTTQTKDYPPSNGSVVDQPSTSTPTSTSTSPTTGPLQIDRPGSDTVI
jgi:hypothetical protein